MATNLSSPMGKPLAIPLHILLVVGRHMFLNSAVLVEPSVQSMVGTDSISSKENLYYSSGKPDIPLLLDVLKGAE